MLHDDLAEDFAGLDVLQSDIRIDRGLHVAVAEETPDQFVLARPALQNYGTGGVPELVHRQPQPCAPVDALADLAAE
jgi:hypothetical protein